jgi:Flp pilus assembly protein TadB
MTRTTLLWLAAAALAAGLAAWSLVPPAALARLRPRRTGQWPRWLPAAWQARPGALPPRTRWLAGAAAGLALTVGLWSPGPGLGQVVSLGLGGAAVPVAFLVLGRFERGADRDRDLVVRLQAPSALDAIAACLEAGLPLRRATEVVAGLSPPAMAALLGRVVQGIGVGLSDAEAWSALGDDAVFGLVARDVARAADWGTAVGDLLTGHADQLRRDLEADAKTRARAVGVRTALPLGLCYLPAFFLLGLVPMIASGVAGLLGR